jgi:hypothetical protein
MLQSNVNWSNPHSLRLLMPATWSSRIRFSMPNESANDAAFKADTVWFAKHKDRWNVIRKASEIEFSDVDATFGINGKLVFTPQLWCLVTRHPTLGFMSVPVFRGSLAIDCDAQGYLLTQTDEMTLRCVRLFNDRLGMDVQEMNEWTVKLKEARQLFDIGNAIGKAN